MAYDEGAVGLHAPIKVRYTGKNTKGEMVTGLVDCTVGYIIFNDSITAGPWFCRPLGRGA